MRTNGTTIVPPLASVRDEGKSELEKPAASPSSATTRLRRSRSRPRLEAELEAPFEPNLIQWRAKETRYKRGCGRMGFCLPYADPRAYRDRLNLLFTTKGWTNDFSVVTTTAKVIVTCRLTLDVLGTKAATGEEWLKNENAATSAEAQSFKRACACFGLGRYLYSFVGSWLTLDEEMRPASPPVLPKWATPDGWRDGYRPEPAGPKPVTNAATVTEVAEANSRGEKSPVRSGRNFKNVIQDIRNLKPTLGDRLYRHLLKHVAHVFRPEDIREIALQHKVLALMNSARRGLERLRAARAKVSESVAQDILRSAELQSFDEIPDMTTLQQVVLGLERASDGLGSAANPQG